LKEKYQCTLQSEFIFVCLQVDFVSWFGVELW